MLIGDEASVAEYVAWFAKLKSLALFGDEVRDVITAIAHEYRAQDGG